MATGTITVGYDDRGYKQSLLDPDMGSWTYVHNSLGQLISQTDAAIDPGSVSPLGPAGVMKAPWKSIDNMHITPHQGMDWAYPRR